MVTVSLIMNKVLSSFKKMLLLIGNHKYLWTIFVFIIIVGFIDKNSYYNYFVLKNENARLSDEIKLYEEKFNHDYSKLQQLKSDPQALIRVAREDHQMKSVDEDVYYIVKSDSIKAN